MAGSFLGRHISTLLPVMVMWIICIDSCSLPREPIPTATKTVENPRQGVYITNDPGDLPLPSSGYEIYLIGEQIHGTNEVHMFLLKYLQILHESTGLRDVALENGRGYERAVNQYVMGLSENTSVYWYTGWEGILEGIKSYNQDLPDGEKIRLHLVDVHGELSTIYAYMEELKEMMGPVADQIEVPPLSKFEQLDESDMLALLDQFGEIRDNPPALTADLDTLRASIKYHFTMDQVNRGIVPIGAAIKIRDECIASNVLYVLNALDGSSLLALYGGWHAQKRRLVQAVEINGHMASINAEPWAEILANSGVDIYSLLVGGLTGKAHPHLIMNVESDPGEIYFPDGSTLADLLNKVPDNEVIYIDLRSNANGAVRIGKNFDPWTIYDGEMPAEEAFDGLILFKEVTPTEWRFPSETYPSPGIR
jgi:hypothetical protein